jgi:hypothetical protein
VRSVKEEVPLPSDLAQGTVVAESATQFPEHYHADATINGRTTCCSSLLLLRLSRVADVASAVENAVAAYSGTRGALHEYLTKWGI